ncbi:MAG: hypothetical protein B6227_05815 [Fusobacteriia bacterium 4572_74]|nr:MAG: hypothetical protein B6227_05815 [Fusobacteriia bacterium 4572_74]
MRKKEMIAMLLAGGQGSRLVPLTSDVAKPAIDFGGKYKIIDFPLSNCTNSGVDTVGILTQYRPFLLNAHIGTGSAWDLDSMHGGTAILPPYTTQEGGAWYKGTANAIYQNIQYIDRYDPDHVLILSGDHIYKMDYNKMLKQHKEEGADVTIAALSVSLEEAKRFGIMNVKDENIIYEFEEKPEKPKSNLAEANMDLLNENNNLNLYKGDWKIYTSGEPKGAAYFGKNANIENSMAVDGCEVYGSIENTVLFPGVIVEEGAVVKNSVLFPNVKIGKGVILDRVIVGENTNVLSGTHIGDATIKVIPQNKTIK